MNHLIISFLVGFLKWEGEAESYINNKTVFKNLYNHMETHFLEHKLSYD